MVVSASLVWVVSMAVLTTCLPMTPPAGPVPVESNTLWLPFLSQDLQATISPPLASPYQSDTNTRTKRVFLSRGWGPGGYDSPPPPPPQRFARRPLLPASLGQTNTESPFLPPLAPRERAGQARFAALVASQRQEVQQKPQYRRFHSIFTSGTWSPLGKRGAVTNEGSRFIPATGRKERKEEESEDEDTETQLLFTDTGPLVKDKRSRVFASHGWGAGGAATPTGWTDAQHPWRPAPFTTSDNGGGSNGGSGDRYVASFRSGGPLLHHFLSHGWRPMGR